MTHPFTKGQSVLCIRGVGYPTHAETGKVYTIKRAFIGPPSWGGGGGPIPGMDKTPGVELVEHPGDAYTADRFEAIKEAGELLGLRGVY